MLDTTAIPLAQTAVELAGTLAFAVSGILVAARRQLDPVGVVVAASLTAFGGGTLRDVLLDRRPFSWVEHPSWLWAVLALCVGAMLFMRSRHFLLAERSIQWPDALGMGLFASVGTRLAWDSGLPALVATLLGVITAVFGGVLRDVVCNEIPVAFSDHRPYALCAFIGGWTLLGAQAIDVPAWLCLLCGTACASGLRTAAIVTGYTLPTWRTE